MRKLLALGMVSIATVAYALFSFTGQTWLHDNEFLFNSSVDEYANSKAFDVDVSTYPESEGIPRVYAVGSAQPTGFPQLTHWTHSSFGGTTDWARAANPTGGQETPPDDQNKAIKTWIFSSATKEYRVVLGEKAGDLAGGETQPDFFIQTAVYSSNNDEWDSGTSVHTPIGYEDEDANVSTTEIVDEPIDVTGRMVGSVPTIYVLTGTNGKAQVWRFTLHATTGAVSGPDLIELANCEPTAIHCEPTTGSPNSTVFVTGQRSGHLFLWQMRSDLSYPYDVDLALPSGSSIGTTKPCFRSTEIYVAGTYSTGSSNKDFILAKFSIGDDVVEAVTKYVDSNSLDTPTGLAVSHNGVYITGVREVYDFEEFDLLHKDWLTVRYELTFEDDDSQLSYNIFSGLSNDGIDTPSGIFIYSTNIYVGGKAELSDGDYFKVIHYNTALSVVEGDESRNSAWETLESTGFRGRHVGETTVLAVCGIAKYPLLSDPTPETMAVARFYK